MRKRTIIAGAAALLLAIGTTGTAEAQSDNASHNVNFAVPQVLAIDLNGGGDVDFGELTQADLDNGSVTDNSASLDYRGNVDYDVTVEAGASTFSGGDGSKPASDLHVTLDAGASDVALGTTAQDLVSGARGRTPSAQLTYELFVDYEDEVDTSGYSLEVIYTIAPAN